MSDEKGKAPDRAPKHVSFSEDTKPDVSAPAPEEKEEEFVDGVIGQLEVHQSGAVKMRLGNGILLDVSTLVLIILIPVLTQDLQGYCGNPALVSPTNYSRGSQ